MNTTSWIPMAMARPNIHGTSSAGTWTSRRIDGNQPMIRRSAKE
ncbi:hypothetical protein [Actinophytocola sp.]|nr:hypothetical protein [Actinophytocola sp.]